MELIEKAWTKIAIKNFFEGLNHEATEEDMQKIIDAAAIIEIKRSVWKAKNFHTMNCDNCNFEFDMMKCDFLEKMNYCLNCGANMQQQTKEENGNE